jgi:sterol desaturase/sphingolipid hydroxylase (fatty acid hydroxylase superfamily)
MDIEPKTIIAGVALVVLWTAEGFAPFYPHFGSGFGTRLRHDARNLGLGMANALLLALLFGAAFMALEVWADDRGFGLLRATAWPGWLELLLVLLLFDLWMYAWHRANHRIPFLWRFHRMHHSDPEMDVSTGLRFHPGEMLLSALARMAVLPLLGMSLWHLVVYEALLLPVILFHHSNVRLPRWLDYGLLALVVTPAMHRVHHSRWQPETDSNYGSILPWWDRIFRSFRLREDAGTIALGLEGLDGAEWQSLSGMLKTPVARVGGSASARDTPPEDAPAGEEPILP